jgi:LysM repeat protein
MGNFRATGTLGEDAGPVGKDARVTRELKLALIVGLSLVLVVGVLITDHVKRSDTPNSVTPLAADNPVSLTSVGQPTPDPFTPGTPIAPTDDTFKPKAPEIIGHTVIDQTAPKGSIVGPQTKTENDLAGKSSQDDPLPSAPKPTATPDRPYTIASGDTLYSICKKQYNDGSLHAKLAEYNKLADGKSLKLNQKIVLPAKEVLKGEALPFVKSSTVTPLPEAKVESKPSEISPLNTTMFISYKVVSGDTLSSIARRHDLSLARLRELNPSIRGREDQIAVGDELKVPKIAKR